MHHLLEDARQAFRSLWRTPGVTGAALVCLTAGIAVNTSIFSVVYGVLWRPLPVPEARHVVTLWELEAEGTRGNIGYETFADWRRRSASYQAIAAVRSWMPQLTGDGEPQRLRGVRVTQEYFDVIGVQPALGRAFTAEEDRPGNDAVVVISHDLWRQRFNGDPSAVGRTMTLSGNEQVVVGVMPEDFEPVVSAALYEAADIWAPLGYEEGQDSACRTCCHLRSVARLASGVSLRQAQAEMNAIGRDLKAAHPGDYDTGEIAVVGLADLIVGETKPALYVLLGAVGMIMLIACANVANLLLARSTIRRREFAIRAALGASHWRVARQLLAEGVVLGVLAALAGLVLSIWGIDGLRALAPESLPRIDAVAIDPAVLAFTLAMALATGVLFSLAPALDAAGVHPSDALKEESRSSASPARQRTRRVLVVAEISLAIVLLVGAGLFVRSFQHLNRVDPGFRTDNLLTCLLIATYREYPEDEARLAFYDDVLARLRVLPGVEAATLVSTLPFGGSYDTIGMYDASLGEVTPPDAPSPDRYGIGPGYFEAMGIPLLAGRTLGDTDGAGAPPVVVVNQTLASRLWPGEDPLGRRVRLGGGPSARVWTIVGVVGDVRHYGFEGEQTMQVYLPHAQWPTNYMNLLVRASTPDVWSIVPPLRREVWAINGNVAVQDVMLMDDLLGRSVGERRFTTSLVSGFALVAGLLAALGMYAVISYGVTQRTREIGIRMALGANRGDVVRLLLREGLAVALPAVAIGLVGAWSLARLIEGSLFGVGGGDPLTYATVAALGVGMSVAAGLAPALRAGRVSPLDALRHE